MPADRPVDLLWGVDLQANPTNVAQQHVFGLRLQRTRMAMSRAVVATSCGYLAWCRGEPQAAVLPLGSQPGPVTRFPVDQPTLEGVSFDVDGVQVTITRDRSLVPLPPDPTRISIPTRTATPWSPVGVPRRITAFTAW